MSEQLPLGRGRAPWRAPRTPADWLVTLAWLQLVLLLAWAAMLGFISWTFADFDSIACFDADDPGCAVQDSGPWFGGAEAVASVATAGAAVVAVLVTHLARGGRASCGAALGAVAAFWACAIGSALLTIVPA